MRITVSASTSGLLQITHTLIVYLLLSFDSYAIAQSHPVCGSPPEIKGIPQEQIDEFKGQIEGQAKLLSRLIGHAQLSGQIESSKKTITQNFPNLDRAIAFRYFQYVTCVVIMNDSTLSTLQKLDALQKINPKF